MALVPLGSAGRRWGREPQRCVEACRRPDGATVPMPRRSGGGGWSCGVRAVALEHRRRRAVGRAPVAAAEVVRHAGAGGRAPRRSGCAGRAVPLERRRRRSCGWSCGAARHDGGGGRAVPLERRRRRSCGVVEVVQVVRHDGGGWPCGSGTVSAGNGSALAIVGNGGGGRAAQLERRRRPGRAAQRGRWPLPVSRPFPAVSRRRSATAVEVVRRRRRSSRSSRSCGWSCGTTVAEVVRFRDRCRRQRFASSGGGGGRAASSSGRRRSCGVVERRRRWPGTAERTQ